MITRFSSDCDNMPEVKVNSARNSVEVFTEAGRIKLNNLNKPKTPPTAQSLIDSVIWQTEPISKPKFPTNAKLNPSCELYYD